MMGGLAKLPGKAIDLSLPLHAGARVSAPSKIANNSNENIDWSQLPFSAKQRVLFSYRYPLELVAMRNANFTFLFGALSRPTMPAFSVLFTLEPLSRSIIITVVPLMALERFGNARDVSVFFFVLGILGVLMSLAVPWLVSRITRRGTFALGIISGLAGMALFTQDSMWSFCAGMALHLFSAACIDVALNLFMMQHIRRQDFGSFEPVRMFFLAFAWSVGPFLGVLLRNSVDPAAPFIFGSVMLVLLGSYFYYLRFTDNPAVVGKRPSVTNPIRYLPRYFAQPRLLLVYILSTVRSGWWLMYFIYVPIYCVTSGLGETVGGALVSLATACVMTTPLLRGAIRRYGIRRILMVGYLGTGFVTILLALSMSTPHLAVAVILLAALFAVLCDSVGNTLFYRAVRSWERSEMATVFSSYRPVSSLAFPGIYSGLLAVFALPAVFAATGLGMIAAGFIALYIPKKMR
ncbi:MAG: MFS transporter [Pseudomonadota bacterium]